MFENYAIMRPKRYIFWIKLRKKKWKKRKKSLKICVKKISTGDYFATEEKNNEAFNYLP